MYTCERNVSFEIKKNIVDEIYFKSPCPSGNEKTDNAKALLYKAKDPKGAVIFIHGTGNKNFKPLQYYPNLLSQNGYTTLMPVLPYHFERTAENERSGSMLLKGDAVEIGQHFDQCVTDILTCADFLESLNFKKINIMGMSFGGIIATISMAIDERFNKGAFIITGGNFEHITWHSVATKVLRISYEDEGSCSKDICAETHKKFNKAANEFTSLKDLDNFPPCFRYDPSLFAKFIPNENVIMINALFDAFIPKKSSNDLWERLNKPKKYSLPAGHLTSHILFKKFIANKCIEFFDK